MQITILPASSKTAQATIRSLLSTPTNTNLHIRGLYRDPTRAPPEFTSHPAFHATHGDIRDANTLDLAGTDALFVMTPPRHDVDDIFQWAREASENTRAAIERSSVRRVVLLSSMGAEFESGTGEIRTNHIAEEILQDAAPEVVIVRAAYFMENWAGGVSSVKDQENPYFESVITPLEYEVPMVAIKDIGSACAAHLLTPTLPESPYIFELHGPKPYSVLDVQRAFKDATGKDVAVRPVEKQDLPAFFGQFLPPALVGPFVEMTVGFLPGGVMAQGNPDAEKRVQRGRTGLGDVIGGFFEGSA
ncbi:NAD(P)-binding protein [Aspergillus campestris IBT 28561]|uniref:NAD(P)-binding protein n=1 Tax=Aspergillus campestris (strain IBT 28561) TaxID=1392248 RepID=A0A2I1CU92_ASPC2|nr:NAD(P)-binding protein [Aspergillus campestris IBT 28561]PKY01179.1 NAD(P)-binding protein [Aspergillus campestris IBT 28561]